MGAHCKTRPSVCNDGAGKNCQRAAVTRPAWQPCDMARRLTSLCAAIESESGLDVVDQCLTGSFGTTVRTLEGPFSGASGGATKKSLHGDPWRLVELLLNCGWPNGGTRKKARAGAGSGFENSARLDAGDFSPIIDDFPEGQNEGGKPSHYQGGLIVCQCPQLVQRKEHG